MDEKQIRKRIKKISIFVAAVSVLLLTASGIFAVYLNHTLKETMNDQMAAEAEEYKNRIQKQIDATVQNLNTLAGFIEFSNITDPNQFAEALYASSLQNNFISMSYFKKDGAGMIATGDGIKKVDSIDLIPYAEMNDVVKKAWNGEKVFSNLFHDEHNDDIKEKIFVYGVPVYKNGTIIGALTASDQLRIFSDILDGKSVMGGNGYIHMLDMDGRFLVQSKRSAVQERLDTIFDGPYLSPSEELRVKDAIQQQESIFSSFQYQGRNYQFIIYPLGINNWCLFCVNTTQGVNASIYQMVNAIALAFAAILFLAIFWIFFSYRLLRKNNRELVQLAYNDILTGAKNRSWFMQELKAILEHSEGCVAALNINQFKFINEIFGKEQADALLCYMKKTLDKHMRSGDFFCRDTADLFYIFLKQTDQTQIQTRLKEIMDDICRVSAASNSNYQLLLYCGAVIAAPSMEHKLNADSLMINVMFALAKAKGTHQNNIWFYDTELHKKEELEHYAESHMHQALQNGEFKLFLQPKFNLKTNALDSAEALVRWITDDGTTIFPGQFIPLFEKNGFCTQLDLYMVECVCREIRKWIELGITPIPVSVNQSKLLFYQTDYITNLNSLLKQYNIPAHLITLEILEELAAENVDELNSIIRQLQECGFKVSIDDFGSGYSSLNTLGNLNIDELKLDRGFLMKTSKKENQRLQLIMAQIVQLAKQLNISIVVEGIETLENEQLCKSMGCDYGQGYYYSKPITALDFRKKFLEPSPQ